MLLDELRAERLERDASSGWTRRQCDVLEEWWPDKAKIGAVPRLLLNGIKAIDLNGRHREIDPAHWPVAMGELARLYLSAAIHLADPPPRSPLAKGRIPYQTRHVTLANTPPPYFFDPPACRDGRWARVDLTNAYWQILSAGRADMFFDPDGLGVGVGKVAYPRPREVTRDLGRCLSGIMGRYGFRELRHGTPSVKEIPSRFFAPDAVAYLQWTLHALALEAARGFGAVSWVVDGAIVPDGRADAYREHLEASWGLSAVISPRGVGHLYGLSRWRFGGESRGIRPGEEPRDIGGSSNLLDLAPADVDRLCGLRWWLLERT